LINPFMPTVAIRVQL